MENEESERRVETVEVVRKDRGEGREGEKERRKMSRIRERGGGEAREG